MDLDLSHFKVTHDEDQDEENIEENEDGGDNYKRAISERLNMAQQKDCKILAFKQQVPKAEEGKQFLFQVVPPDSFAASIMHINEWVEHYVNI